MLLHLTKIVTCPVFQEPCYGHYRQMMMGPEFYLNILTYFIKDFIYFFL